MVGCDEGNICVARMICMWHVHTGTLYEFPLADFHRPYKALKTPTLTALEARYSVAPCRDKDISGRLPTKCI